MQSDDAQVTATELVPLPEGQRQFGRYHLLYRIGTGGMANLYLARFTGPDGFEKLVAIKRIHEHLSAQSSFLKMFKDEARLAGRISHPNVVQVIELGEHHGAYYIAMEYLDGENLTALLNRTRLHVPIAARIIADALGGLHAAHELRSVTGELVELVHRDLSPSNILIGYEGSTKVVDFGVARARGTLHITEAGMVKGKFAYMSPEQIGNQALDRRSDIFSMGILLYEISTYSRLFRADNDAASVAMILAGTVPPPSTRLPGYPPLLEQIVMKALERDPDKRWASAKEMQLALEAYIYSSGSPVPSSSVGDLMRTVFKDRIDKKGQLLKASLADPTVIPALEQSDLTMRLPIAAIKQQQLQKKQTAARASGETAPPADTPAGSHTPTGPGRPADGAAVAPTPPAREETSSTAGSQTAEKPAPAATATAITREATPPIAAAPGPTKSATAAAASGPGPQASSGKPARAAGPGLAAKIAAAASSLSRPGAAGAGPGRLPAQAAAGPSRSGVTSGSAAAPSATKLAETKPAETKLAVTKPAETKPTPAAGAGSPARGTPAPGPAPAQPLVPKPVAFSETGPGSPLPDGAPAVPGPDQEGEVEELGSEALEEMDGVEAASPEQPAAPGPPEVAVPQFANAEAPAAGDSVALLPGEIPSKARPLELDDSELLLWPRRRKLIFAGAGLLLAAGLLVLILSLAGGDPEVPKVPRQVELTVDVKPARAIVLVDGKRRSSPFTLRGAAGSAGPLLQVSAPGFRPRELRVTYQGEGPLRVELQALPPDAGLPDASKAAPDRTAPGPDLGLPDARRRPATAVPPKIKKVDRKIERKGEKKVEKKKTKGLFGNPYED